MPPGPQPPPTAVTNTTTSTSTSSSSSQQQQMSMQSKDVGYTWHLSLRLDRPIAGCAMRPHAYMYSKKLDERDVDRPLAPHSKRSLNPPPSHDFAYRWFRGPRTEPCAYRKCPRRTSFSPHDWSKHALGGGCSLQCVSAASNLYRATFCNSTCFREAWKSQVTISSGGAGGAGAGAGGMDGGGGGMGGGQSIVASPPPPQPPQHSGGSGTTATVGAHHHNQYRDRAGSADMYRKSSGGGGDDMSVGSAASGPPPMPPMGVVGGGGNIPEYIPQAMAATVRGASAAPPSSSSSPFHSRGDMTVGGGTPHKQQPSASAGEHPSGGAYVFRDGGGVVVGHASSGAAGLVPPPGVNYSGTDGSGSAYGVGSAAEDGEQNGGDGNGMSLGGTDNGANSSNPSVPSSSSSSSSWIEISRDQFYVPSELDVGRKLQLEAAAIAHDTGEVLMHRVVKTDIVLGRAPAPLKRNLVTVKNQGGAGGGGARFRVVTYNVLAEIYATQQQYPYCDFWALSWEYRFQNLMREIIDVGPDVMCLQEVQADHYTDHVYGALSEAGFDGVYKQKTRASMGLAGKVDGCALFWRRTKFHLVETYSIELNELAQRHATQVMGYNPRSEEGAAYINRLSRDNVAQLVVLELVNPTLPTRSNREPINQICVANTHLYSHKDYPDVKLWQTWQLLQELENFIVMSARNGQNLPLMICGDFNSTPDTAVYDLLSRQAVHPGHPDVNGSSGSGDDNNTNVLPDVMALTHSFQLGSVYHTVMGEEPPFTNYTVNFRGVLDYMWYSAQLLRPLSAAPIPDEAELTARGDALPSTQYSSDHVMLISDMQILYGPRPPP